MARNKMLLPFFFVASHATLVNSPHWREQALGADAGDDGRLNITVDWFTGQKHNFEKLLLRPLLLGGAFPANLTYMEIGSLEGLSARWLGDHIISKSAGGVIHCVDTFGGGAEHHESWFVNNIGSLEARFDSNVRQYLESSTIVKHVGFSRHIMSGLLGSGQEASFDFIYVDGSHAAVDVLGDAVMAFWLTKPGGIIAFDDFTWTNGENIMSNRFPRPALDAFLSIFNERLRVLHMAYQLWVQRLD